MKTYQTLKRWLADGCIYYTAITVFFLFINFVSRGADAIRASSFLLMLPCGLMISVGTQILRNKKLSNGIRYWSHYLFTFLGAFLFLWLPADSAATPMAGFLLFLLFSILYWIVLLLGVLISKRIQRVMSKG